MPNWQLLWGLHIPEPGAPRMWAGGVSGARRGRQDPAAPGGNGGWGARQGWFLAAGEEVSVRCNHLRGGGRAAQESHTRARSPGSPTCFLGSSNSGLAGAPQNMGASRGKVVKALNVTEAGWRCASRDGGKQPQPWAGHSKYATGTIGQASVWMEKGW